MSSVAVAILMFIGVISTPEQCTKELIKENEERIKIVRIQLKGHVHELIQGLQKDGKVPSFIVTEDWTQS